MLDDVVTEEPVELVEAVGQDAEGGQREGLGGVRVLAAEPLVLGVPQGQQPDVVAKQDLADPGNIVLAPEQR